MEIYFVIEKSERDNILKKAIIQIVVLFFVINIILYYLKLNKINYTYIIFIK